MNKKIFLVLFLLFGLVSFTSATIVTLPNPLCPSGSGSQGCIDSFPSLIQTITNYITTLITAIVVIVFIWAGILFVTSGGSEQKISTAKKMLLWAVIGTGIALAGQGLVAVITAVFGFT